MSKPINIKNQNVPFWEHLRQNRNDLIVSAITAILAVLILGIVRELLTESLKEWWANRNPEIELRPLDSSLGVFHENGIEKLVQILAYEVSARNLVEDIKITAIFPKPMQITTCYVTYNVDIRGFKTTRLPSNYVELTLDHSLDVSKKAFIYFWTEKELMSGCKEKLEKPNIHIEGKTKNGKVYI